MEASVKNKIVDWAKKGLLVSKPMLGLSYAAVNRRIAREELFPTSFDSIIATNLSVRNEFERMIAMNLVTDFRGLQIKKNILTLYDAQKACLNGDIIKISELGRSAILYII